MHGQKNIRSKGYYDFRDHMQRFDAVLTVRDKLACFCNVLFSFLI